ncbi:MAG: DUF4272 domain-containing protein [Verrucomicrobiae bacterium]|nr:DUF4272 domain-containing protein [Verrucomicrobiae bacterium]
MQFSPKTGRPSAIEVATRLIALRFVIGYGMANPPRDMVKQWYESFSESDKENFIIESEKLRDKFWDPVRNSPLWDAFSPSEKQLAMSTAWTMTEQQQIDTLWRLESFQVLLWALGIIHGLPPYDTPANADLLDKLSSEQIAQLLESPTLLPNEQIDAARELAELWHWRSRTRELVEGGYPLEVTPQMEKSGLRTFDDIVRFTARHAKELGNFEIIDEDFAARGKAYRDLTPEEWEEVKSVSIERHFALNWLCGRAPNNEWDETPTDT